jgi:hypothetical protein
VPINVWVGLVVAAAGVVGFGLWLPWVRHRAHHAQQPGRAGPETMELREEPPAVVDLLVHDLELTGDAVAATILDLAWKRQIEIVELSPEENLVVPRRHADGLAPFEERVLRLVESAAGGGPHATIPGIAQALGSSSARTWWSFAAEVRADARDRGLTVRAGEQSTFTAVFVLSALPCAGIIVAMPLAWLVTPFLFVGLVVSGIFLSALGRTQILTDEGRAAAQHWLGVRAFIAEHDSFDDLPPAAVAVWDRYLAYAAAMGLSGFAVRGLVTELRTTVSVHDLQATARAVQRLRAPKPKRAWYQRVGGILRWALRY